MTSGEFVAWMAFYEIEPFGAVRDNIHSGQIASILYNSKRAKHKAPLSVSDFILKDRYTQKEESTNTFLSVLRAAAEEKVH